MPEKFWKATDFTKPMFYRQTTNKITNTKVLKWQELDVHEDSVPGKGEQRRKWYTQILLQATVKKLSFFFFN